MGGLEEVEDVAGEVSFEAAERFAGGLAFGAFAGEVGLGRSVGAGAGDGDAVQRRVELAAAAAVEPLAVGAARADGDGGDAGGAGELGVAGEALDDDPYVSGSTADAAESLADYWTQRLADIQAELQ